MDNLTSADEGLRELALFAGAGGGILGGKLLGWQTVCAVEYEPYAASVLLARQNDGLLPPFRFGMTFELLTDDLGEDVLTWYLAGFRVPTSAQQDAEQESKENKAGSGWKWRESSVKYDPDMRLWKTRQCSLLEDSEWFSETWPQWGLMRDGESWELPMSERPTFESVSGLWPTPRASDAERGGRGDLIQTIRGNPNKHYKFPTPTASSAGSNKSASSGAAVRPTLETMARHNRWPTKRANNAEKRGQVDVDNPRNGLVGAVQKFPTSTRHDSKGKSGAIRGKNAQGGETLTQTVGGTLNPAWEELLMGWPLNWTSLEPLDSAEMHGWGDNWERNVPRTTTDKTALVPRLKAIGNGQVPQCAAMAWRVLSENL